MSVKCVKCGKEVKPQVVRQVVEGEGGRGRGKQRLEEAWCKNIDKKDCPTFHPSNIFNLLLGLWDGHTNTIFVARHCPKTVLVIFGHFCSGFNALFEKEISNWTRSPKFLLGGGRGWLAEKYANPARASVGWTGERGLAICSKNETKTRSRPWRGHRVSYLH